MFVRYEVSTKDFKELGLFEAIEKAGIPMDVASAILSEFSALPTPHCAYYDDYAATATSWFTDEGERRFAPAIKRLLAAYGKTGKVRVFRREKRAVSGIIYSDQWQVVTSCDKESIVTKLPVDDDSKEFIEDYRRKQIYQQRDNRC